MFSLGFSLMWYDDHADIQNNSKISNKFCIIIESNSQKIFSILFFIPTWLLLCHVKTIHTVNCCKGCSCNLLDLALGPDYMVSFILGWNFSPASETNPLKTKLSITWRGIQPGAQFSRAENPSPVSSNRTRIFRRTWKSEKVPCNRNRISARAEKGTRACALTVFSHLSKLSHGNLRFAPGLKLSM